MGIFEQVQSGSIFTRATTTITNTPISSSTTAFGGTYILLSVEVNNTCRIRLYSDSASVGIDDARLTSSLNISESVGLVLDTFVTTPTKLYFDPPIFGTAFLNDETWYNISGSSVSATFTYYPIESAIATREGLQINASSLPPGTSQQGSITSPKAFLILSASCNNSETRLRLYSKDISEVPVGEIGREFGDPPTTQSRLISDMVFDSASYAYKLTPILQAYNLDTYEVGERSVSYILENLSTSTTKNNITASLYVYSIED